MIKPELKSLLSLLNEDFRLVVPDYQRPFSWKMEEVGELLEDLQGYLGKSTGLYLGSIILDVSRQDDKVVEIVDGQQRLTTLFLLLMACRDHARTIGAIKQAEKIQSQITFTDAILNETEGMKLGASESIRFVFEIMASSDWDSQFPAHGHKMQVRRLQPLYAAFRDHLKEKTASDLAGFQAAILNLRIMRIDIDAKEEAFSIFERTNARGLDLEVADLMKNYLYQTAGSSVGEVWAKITKNSGHAMLRMLKGFFVSRNGYVQKSELYKRLRKYAEVVGGGDKLAEQILEYSNFVNFAHNPGTNPESSREFFVSAGFLAVAKNQDRVLEAQASLQALALFKIRQALPLIFAFMIAAKRMKCEKDSTTAKAFTRMLHALESFHFVNTYICSHIGNEVEHFYADACAEFAKATDIVKTLDKVIGQLSKKRASLAEFTGKFEAVEYASTSSARARISYIFDRLNNYKRSPGEKKIIFYPSVSEFEKSLNIEHIFPMKGDGPKPKRINSIGNLLVISKQLNSKLQHRPVAEKFKELMGPSAASASEFPTVKALIDRFQDSAVIWNDEVIATRTDVLAKLAYEKVWAL